MPDPACGEAACCAGAGVDAGADVGAPVGAAADAVGTGVGAVEDAGATVGVAAACDVGVCDVGVCAGVVDGVRRTLGGVALKAAPETNAARVARMARTSAFTASTSKPEPRDTVHPPALRTILSCFGSWLCTAKFPVPVGTTAYCWPGPVNAKASSKALALFS